MADAYKQDQGDSSSVGASSSKSEATFAPSAPPLGGRPEHQALLGGDKENRDSEAGHYHDDKLKTVSFAHNVHYCGELDKQQICQICGQSSQTCLGL